MRARALCGSGVMRKCVANGTILNVCIVASKNTCERVWKREKAGIVRHVSHGCIVKSEWLCPLCFPCTRFMKAACNVCDVLIIIKPYVLNETRFWY